MATQMQAVDSLVANEFHIEINDTVVNGIFGVRGLVTFQLDDNGTRVKPPFEIVKMVQRDSSIAFNKWLRETIDNRDTATRPTRNVAIVAVDDGVETRRWVAKDAYITAIRYSAYDSASFEMVEEIYTVHYSDIEEIWADSK